MRRGCKKGGETDMATPDWVKITDSRAYDNRGCLALALSVRHGMATDDACRFAGTKATTVEAPDRLED